MNTTRHLPHLLLTLASIGGLSWAADPAPGDSRQADLGGGVKLEVVFIPPGEFLMGSTPEEKAWATGIEGGATPGTAREPLNRRRNGS